MSIVLLVGSFIPHYSLGLLYFILLGVQDMLLELCYTIEAFWVFIFYFRSISDLDYKQRYTWLKALECLWVGASAISRLRVVFWLIIYFRLILYFLVVIVYDFSLWCIIVICLFVLLLFMFEIWLKVLTVNSISTNLFLPALLDFTCYLESCCC